MKGFLKCYYGFKNLGDELLFWWVLDYIDSTYADVDKLTVEVESVEWMEQWREKNLETMTTLKLAPAFIAGHKSIEFVPLSKNILDNFRYDIYFFGGGEIFAESRGFHGGWNYLLRYLYPILKKRFVLLGGIESAQVRRQKLLYHIVLPRAQRVVCREKTSYNHVAQYNQKVALAHDFALPVIDRYRQQMNGNKLSFFEVKKPYVILNIVESVSSEELYEKIKIFLTELYPEATPVYLYGKSVNSDDAKFAQRLEGAYPTLRTFEWERYPLSELLALFDGARAGIASRLHILLLLQEFEKPFYAPIYAQKVEKLITPTLDL